MNKAIQFINSTKGFYKVLNQLKVLSASKGHCLAELKVGECHTNAIGGLHGGCSATIVDVVTTAALKTIIGDRPHESKGINLIYSKAAVIGEEILIEAKMVKSENGIIHLMAELKNKKSGKILVKGTHLAYTNTE